MTKVAPAKYKYSEKHKTKMWVSAFEKPKSRKLHFQKKKSVYFGEAANSYQPIK